MYYKYHFIFSWGKNGKKIHKILHYLMFQKEMSLLWSLPALKIVLSSASCSLSYLLQCFGATLIWSIAVLIKKWSILKVSKSLTAGKQASKFMIILRYNTTLCCQNCLSVFCSNTATEEPLLSKGMFCTFGQQSLSLSHYLSLSLSLSHTNVIYLLFLPS